jgi:hypothetical protein
MVGDFRMTKETPRYWTPLVKLRPDETYRRPEIVRETMTHYGIDEAAAAAMLDAEDAKVDCYINHLYQVQVGTCGPDNRMLHINIRRRDGSMFKDWRHFQQIKNEIAGPEREAFELYPAESRKVDTSNKWHLWVLPEGVQMNAIGWTKRDVRYVENSDVPGMRQRKL